MDLFAHPPGQRGVDSLVPLDLSQPLEGIAHDQRLKMLAVAHDFDAFAGQACLDGVLDGFRCGHLGLAAAHAHCRMKESLKKGISMTRRWPTLALLRQPAISGAAYIRA